MTSDSTETFSDEHHASAPPAPPRAVTPRGSGRSWHERRVRLWLLLSVIVTLTTVYFAIRDINIALRERRLILEGTKVAALIESIDGFDRKSRDFTRDEPRRLRLSYPGGDGKTYTTEQQLPGRQVGSIRVGDSVELRMDPNDPSIVTLQTQPKPWPASLAVVCLLAPTSILLLMWTFIQRKRVLAVWRDGEATEAIAIDQHRSGIAPRSALLRFTLDAEDDRRVFSTLYPHSAPPLETGDAFWIVMPKNKPDKAIVASLYA